MHLLFVCTGNTCRSPMAEVVARSEAARRGLSGVEVRSVGTFGGGDIPASELAEEAVAARGLSLKKHRSRRLSSEDVRWADLVLCMNPSHLAAVLAMDPNVRVDLLSSFLPEGHPGRGHPILDPMGGSRGDYEETLTLLERAIQGLFDAIRAAGQGNVGGEAEPPEPGGAG